MKVALTGAGRMLGHAVRKVFSILISYRFSRAELDITSLDDAVNEDTGCPAGFLLHHAAALRVDACETEPETAYLVNGIERGTLAIPARNIACDPYQFRLRGSTARRPSLREWDIPRPVAGTHLKANGSNSCLSLRTVLYRAHLWLYGARQKLLSTHHPPSCEQITCGW